MKSRSNFKSEESYKRYLRKVFAKSAMQGILAKEAWTERFINEEGNNTLIKDVAKASVKLADALLKELGL